MDNGTKVRFSSYNQSEYNGRKEYLAYHDHKDGCDIIGVAFYTGHFWQLLHYRYKSLKELKAVVRHKYTGADIPDSNSNL